MPRRLGASVPATVSRLLQGGLIPQPPAWFSAVGSVAPLRPSLTRTVPKQSTSNDSSNSSSSSRKGKETKKQPAAASSSSGSNDNLPQWQGNRRLSAVRLKSMKYRPPKPAPIQGMELHDKLRRMFYADHPFEAFRGINLVEADGVLDEETKPGPKGEAWTELRQRSWNPSPEDCVDFAINMHTAHGIPVALAYSSAVQQFQSLRASYEISLNAAQAELEAHGLVWPTEFSPIDRLVRAEDRNIADVLKDGYRPAVADTTVDIPLRSIGSLASSSSLATSTPASRLLNPEQAKPKAWSQGKDYLSGRKASSTAGSSDSRGSVAAVTGEARPDDLFGLGPSSS